MQLEKMRLQGMEKKRNIIFEKILYTTIILLVYFIGKNLPLYMVDHHAYTNSVLDAEDLLLQTISGDMYQCSLFALGISPFMIGSMIVQVISAFRNPKKRSKISPKKTNRISLGLTLIIALVQAIVRVMELQFRVDGHMLVAARCVSVVEMITGAMIILWLCNRNKLYGIGGQSALIFVNIVDGINATMRMHDAKQLLMPLLIALGVMMIVIIMENSEMRIPVQRISIHNIYADKNYLAIKLNPIGVMPAMFSTAFFMIPRLFLNLIGLLFPENATIFWMQENMSLDKPLGIVVYMALLYTLTIGFSRVFINPREITEQYLKSGDSLLNIHSGEDTQKYISKVMNRIGVFSATVMCICLGVPLYFQMTGDLQSSLAALPSSVMMLTGIWCNLYREVAAIKDLEAYEPFI